MNSWNLLGRLTKDPEISVTPNGKTICKFPVAVNRQFNRDETDFFDCLAWGKTGEIIADHFDKGSQIALTGRAQQERWEPKEGGKRSKVIFVVDSFTFCGSKKESAGGDVDF